MSYQLYRELITLTEEFEKAYPGNKGDVTEFAAWLSQKFPVTPTPIWEGMDKGVRPEEVIAVSVKHINRYANIYIKKALEGTEFTTLDDFLYLINLLYVRPMSPKELMETNIHQKSGGMEIIKRLIKKELISISGHEKDKRSKLLHITEKGKAALMFSRERVRAVNDIISGGLSGPEKLQLIRLLQKLDDFHNPIFLNHRHHNLEAIMAMVKPKNP